MNSGPSSHPEKQLISPALQPNNPELVTAVEIQQWADRSHAKTAFPELMRRLLGQTPGITNLDIRAHEGVAAPGWDGAASSAGSAYLPAGELRFEFGTNKKIKSKAQSDYDKRLEKLGSDSSKFVFIFATPRSWPNGQERAKERRSEQEFADVKVIDSQRLEGWLQETPSVHYWLSEQLGRNPRKVQTLQAWWLSLQKNSVTQTPPQFYVARRESQSQNLINALQDDRRATPVSVSSTDARDVLAFVYATLQNHTSLLERALIVTDQNAWDHLVEFKKSLLLIPRFNNADVASALAQEHRVLVVIDCESRSKDDNTIVLPKVGRHEAAEILRQEGIDFRQAERMTVLARRSMGALLRMNSKNPDIQKPAWLRDPKAVEILAPLVLIGAWEDGDDRDKNHIERFCGASMSDIRSLVNSLRDQVDSPFLLSGTVWRLVDPVDAAQLLLPMIDPEVIERWRYLAFDVLLAADPRIGLEVTQSIVADIRGIRPECSDTLRKHIAEGLSLAAATSNTLEPQVRCLVKQLLEASFSDQTGETLMSLVSSLHSLAEAAPNEFLSAISEDLNKETPVIWTLFRKSHSGNLPFGSIPRYQYLLRALENLCWSKDYYGFAAMLLAGLADLDPDDHLSNLPFESLLKVTTGCIVQSAASVDDKIAVIQEVIRRYPKVGERLTLSLLESDQHMIVSTTGPRFRDWVLPSEDVTYDELYRFVQVTLDLAIETAGDRSERWIQLIELIRHLPKERREMLVQSIFEIVQSASSSWTDDGRHSMWSVLTAEISHHEAHPDAIWAVPNVDLKPLRQAVCILAKPGDPRQYTGLFGWTIDLVVDGLSWNDDGYNAALKSAQEVAIEDVASQGVDAVSLLIKHVERPEIVGELLVDVNTITDVDIASWLEDNKPSHLRRAGQAYVSMMSRKRGVEWLVDFLAKINSDLAGHSAIVAAIPMENRFWDWVETLEESVIAAYWRTADHRWIPENQCDIAVKFLLRYNCPWRALDVLFRMENDDETVVDSAMIVSVLKSCRSSEEDVDVQHYGYVVSVLLNRLEVTSPDDPDLPGLEFCFFDFVGGDHDPSDALYSLLEGRPDEFVALVESSHSRKVQEGEESTAVDVAFAKLSHSVLYHWKMLPGVRESGVVDGDYLSNWVTQCRALFNDHDDGGVGDRAIGRVLASSPEGQDGIWPAEQVRAVIESLKNEDVEAGFMAGRYNQRGVSVRPIYDGGRFERIQAQEYRSAAKQLTIRWPRTSRILRQMADSYEWDAIHLDKWDERLADE